MHDRPEPLLRAGWISPCTDLHGRDERVRESLGKANALRSRKFRMVQVAQQVDDVLIPSHIVDVLTDPAAYADERIYDAYAWLREK